jgi:hypothetical protein
MILDAESRGLLFHICEVRGSNLDLEINYIKE